MSDIFNGQQSILQATRIEELIRLIREKSSQNGIRKPFVVCGSHLSSDLLSKLFQGLKTVCFEEYTPNPKMEDIEQGFASFKENECDLLVAIGGGSTIDVAKGIKWLLAKQNQELSDMQLWAVPTTAGTGSESTPFAAVYENGVKRSLDDPFLLPNIAVLCGELIATVPAYTRNSAFLDAFCQALESWWSKGATPESIEYSKQALTLLLQYGYDYVEPQTEIIKRLPRAGLDEEKMLQIAQGVLLGANYAGRAIAISRTTAAHAMSYALTTKYGISHGHAVALCFAEVCRAHCEIANRNQSFEGLASVLTEMAEMMDIDTIDDLPRFIEGIRIYFDLEDVSIPDEDIEMLASSVNIQRLNNNPVEFTSEQIAEMYRDMTEMARVVVPTEKEEELDSFHIRQNTARMGRWVLAHKSNWDDVQIIQRYSLDILKDIDQACSDLGIQYFLCEGALLGAVRHQAPIPWDDDIDIGLLREDYDRFVAEAPDYFGDKYTIDTYETNPVHWTISGKVQMTAPTDYMRLRTEGLSLTNGPFVDLFAFDDSPIDHGFMLVKRGRTISALRALLFHSSGFQKRPSKRHPHIKRFLSRFTSVSFLHSRIDSLCRKFEGKNCPFVTNFGSMYKAEKETFLKEDISPVKRVQYGDMQVCIPNNADAVLTKIYGDYMAMPSYWNRRGKHGFIRKENFEEEMRMYLEK